MTRGFRRGFASVSSLGEWVTNEIQAFLDVRLEQAPEV